MYWANFLHFYQPPTQSKYWIDKITGECYRRLVRGFLANKKLKATFNINALLFEFWEEYGHQDVINGLKKLLSRGQIELTGTAKYHPLLPNITEEEIKRQIFFNVYTSGRILGDLYTPTGFFPPEMGYNRKVARVVADLGYSWIIAEELSLNHKFKKVDYTKIYEVAGITVRENGLEKRQRNLLKIFFREREISYQILSGQLATPGPLRRTLSSRLKKNNQYLLTAMDGETFGHHRPGMDKLLFGLLKTAGLETVLVTDLIDLFEKREVVETLPATWALMRHNIEKSEPFARWQDLDNKVHQSQWQLTELAIEAVRACKFRVSDLEFAEDFKLPVLGSLAIHDGVTVENLEKAAKQLKLSKEQMQWVWARQLLDKALHSDQYWWASARPWWSLEMIERGAKALLETVNSVPSISRAEKEKAQQLYYEIITTGFDWQRTGQVEEMSKKEDETVRMSTDQGIPELSSQEIDKMISPIKDEMLEAAKNREYERAAQLRDRIEELEGYKND